MTVTNGGTSTYILHTESPGVTITLAPGDTLVSDDLYKNDPVFREQLDALEELEGDISFDDAPVVRRVFADGFTLPFTTDGSGNGTATVENANGAVLMRVQLDYQIGEEGESPPQVDVTVTSDFPVEFTEHVFGSNSLVASDPDNGFASNLWDHLPAGELAVSLQGGDADTGYVVTLWTLPV